jgi:hypothetical protein
VHGPRGWIGTSAKSVICSIISAVVRLATPETEESGTVKA